jgi:hypothetical protein
MQAVARSGVVPWNRITGQEQSCHDGEFGDGAFEGPVGIKSGKKPR